jgi:ATP-dependent Clp protease protease subunit
MMKKLNISLGGTGSPSPFFLLMEDISLDSCKDAISWIIEANFAEEKPESLNLMICSPGGDLNAAFALIDVMRGSAIPVNTIGIGQIASAGLIIFLAGQKGNRILTPNTSILSHQYSWGAVGKEHELFATIKEFDLTTKKILAHYKKYTNLHDEQEIRDVLLPPHDVWISPKDALKFGICDAVKELK